MYALPVDFTESVFTVEVNGKCSYPFKVLMHNGNPQIVFDDNDGDGLNNAIEIILSTDIDNPDTDDDGLDDYYELIELGTSPLNSDALIWSFTDLILQLLLR